MKRFALHSILTERVCAFAHTDTPPARQVTKGGIQIVIGTSRADPRMTAKYAHVVDMAKKNPALFIPATVDKKTA